MRLPTLKFRRAGIAEFAPLKTGATAWDCEMVSQIVIPYVLFNSFRSLASMRSSRADFKSSSDAIAGMSQPQNTA
jgi:hypothetical protein